MAERLEEDGMEGQGGALSQMPSDRSDSGALLGSAIEIRRTHNPAIMSIVIERRGESLAEVFASRKEISQLAGRLRKIADDLAAYEARQRSAA